MIGFMAIPAHVAKLILVVAPFMTDDPRIPLDTLLTQGFEVKTAVEAQDVVLFLQKGPKLYGCEVPAADLASAFLPAGEIQAHRILCAPFR
jgi:hypothetical protein